MPKTFLAITAAMPIAVSASDKKTVINTGNGPIFLVDQDTDAGLVDFDDAVKTTVIRALGAIEPGKALRMPPGTFRVDFGDSLSSSAILCTETKAPATPPAPPVVPPVDPNAPPVDPAQ